MLAEYIHPEASAENDGCLTALDTAREGCIGFQRGVDDEVTNALMLGWLRLLKQGVGRAEALQQVQRQIRGFAQWSHPLFWAAWQLVGETGPNKRI